jgi:tRNA 2-selenouridine synthase
MSILECQFQDLVSELNEIPWFDARSESEFLRGHIPGSINLPILNNEHRHLVGICYKEKGKEKAIELGFELATPLFPSLIQEAKKYGNKAVVYCWRGGLRSLFLSDLLSKNGITVYRIIGGYKAFRNWCYELFEFKANMLVLSGKTGVNKTKWLEDLELTGEPIIHLEKLARHKGSAFGGIGQLPQPTQEQFENLLGIAIDSTNKKMFWIENESRFIGKLKIPDAFFNQFTSQPHVQIEMDLQRRIEIIHNQYSGLPLKLLRDQTKTLMKRMGNELNQLALNELESGNFHKWIEYLLGYYDKTYTHSKNRSKITGKIYSLHTSAKTTLMEFIELKKIISNEIN